MHGKISNMKHQQEIVLNTTGLMIFSNVLRIIRSEENPLLLLRRSLTPVRNLASHVHLLYEFGRWEKTGEHRGNPIQGVTHGL